MARTKGHPGPVSQGGNEPETVMDFMRRRLQEMLGLGLILLCLAGLVIIATWHQSDPSLNNATRSVAQNWLGVVGAYLSDLLLQTLGLGAAAFFAPPATWGYSFLKHQEPDGFLWRVSGWFMGTFFMSAFLATLPVPSFWPLASGLGGVIGQAIVNAGLMLTNLFASNGIGHLIIAAVSALFSIGLIVFSCSLEDANSGEKTGKSASARTAAARREPRSARAQAEAKKAGTLVATRPGVDNPPPAKVGLGAKLGSLLARKEEEAPLVRVEPQVAGRASVVRAPVAASGEDEFEDDYPSEDADDFPDEIAAETSARAPRVDRPAPRTKPSARAEREKQPALPFDEPRSYELPPLSLLAKPRVLPAGTQLPDEALEQNARILETVLDDFGIRGEIIHVRPGPVVTLYELSPAPGIKSSRVIALADDIARSMSAVSARVAVVPGRNVIGIELPNQKREMVYLRELLESADFEHSSSKLPLALGKNIGGEAVISDLSRMPHLLIAGTTGSGKSVGINTMILSLLYRLPPDKCKLIMVDPKMLELSVYDGIPHLLTPVVTDPKKAVVALKWVVKEMENRYRSMSKVGVRNIEGFNQRVTEAAGKGETISRTVQTGFDPESGKAIYETERMELEPMPFIVVIVDEMADLMMVAGKEIEGAIQRIAQMARAAGIHVITATQRPSVDVITGTIKANFPTRISFQVTSKIDSRTILGEQGAEQLLGQGDMLFMAGGGRIRRVHGPFVSDDEVEKVVSFLKRQGTPEYLEAITDEPDDGGSETMSFGGNGEGDELYDKAVAIVARDKKATTSYIQRRLQIGYNRAAGLIEMMEEQGVISAPNAQGRREVLIGEPGEGARY